METLPPLADEPADERTATEKPWLFAGLLISVVVVWLLFWLLGVALIDDPENRGLFGDMFGAVNALFSGLAFACLVYAVILQRKELALQREDLRLTRLDLQAQNQIIAEQLRTWRDTHELEVSRDKALPVFIPVRPSTSPPKGFDPSRTRVCYFRIGNAPAFNVSFTATAQGVRVETHSQTLSQVEEGKRIWVVFRSKETLPDAIEFTINFVSRTGHKGSSQFKSPDGRYWEPAILAQQSDTDGPDAGEQRDEGPKNPHDNP